MRWWTGRDGPAGSRALVDAAAAALALAFTLVMLYEGGLGTPEAGYRPLDAAGVLLTVVSAAPLAAQRRAPGLVYGLTAVACLTLLVLGYPLDVPPGPLIAAYALAEAVGGDAPARRRAVARLVVAAFVPLAALSMVFLHEALVPVLPGMAAWAAMFAFVWIAGDRSRLRRERIAQLEERALRREREAEAQRRLAAAQERTRIARELHDSAGHAINVILVQAGAARLLHERDPERSRRSIETIEEVARGTIGEIDRLVRALREDEGLQAPAPADTVALEELVDRHRAGGLRISATFRGARRVLPSAVAWAAYRILQEALTNAARHGLGSAEVELSYGARAVEITVRNPAGPRRPPAGGQAGGGLGVVGMRERAALLGGSLDVTTGDGAGPGGFRLRAVLPYATSEGGPRGAAAAGPPPARVGHE